MLWLISYKLETEYDVNNTMLDIPRESKKYRELIMEYTVYDTKTRKTYKLSPDKFEYTARNGNISNAYLCEHKSIYKTMYKGKNLLLEDEWSDIFIKDIEKIPYKLATEQAERMYNSGRRNKDRILIIAYNEAYLVGLDYLGHRKIISLSDIKDGIYNETILINIHQDTIDKIKQGTFDIDSREAKVFTYKLERIEVDKKILDKIKKTGLQNNVISIIAEDNWQLGVNGTAIIKRQPTEFICNYCNNIVVAEEAIKNGDIWAKCKRFAVKDGLTKLPSMVLNRAYELENLELPLNIRKISRFTLTYTKLERLDLRKYSKLNRIEPMSLSDNSYLKELIYSDNIIKLGEIARDNLSLVKLILPKNCNSAFFEKNLPKLEILGLPATELQMKKLNKSFRPENYMALENLREIWTPRVNLNLAKKIKEGAKYPDRIKIVIAERN